jgi:hypothetical protein
MSHLKLVRNLALSETGFVFLPSTGETFTVNELGRVVLRELQDGKTEPEIIQALLQDFDSDQPTIERDVTDFLFQLTQFSLLSEEE